MQNQCQPSNALVNSLSKTCVEKKVTLSLAESCTGGYLASRLTQLSGCSQYFLGAVVAYANQIKIDILGVKEETLKQFGAVSAEVVEEMAIGIMRLTKSDVGLAISGIAGPGGGTDQKPVGTVWSAIAFKDHPCLVWKSLLNGTRQQIIEKATEEILSVLLKQICLLV